jgi:hypothetical protein
MAPQLDDKFVYVFKTEDSGTSWRQSEKMPFSYHDVSWI